MGESLAQEPLQEHTYEFHLSLLGNEVFKVGFTTTSESGRWLGLSVASIFISLIALAMWGDALMTLFK